MATDNPLITSGANTFKPAADVVTHSGDEAYVQLVRLVETQGVEGSRIVIASTIERQWAKSFHTNSYTVVGNGTIIDVSDVAKKFFSMQVSSAGGGTPTAWKAYLQISLNGLVFTNLLVHESGVNDIGSIVANELPFPATSFRSRLDMVTLGPATAINIEILGMP